MSSNMTHEELQTLLQSTETARVERTVSTTNVDKFQEAICAFSNDMANSRQNGYLIIGAKDNGELSGLKVTDDLMKSISSLRSSGNILPIPAMTCERYELEGGDLLVVEVQPSLSPPVRYRGRTFIRIGPRRDIATLDEERMLAEKMMSNLASFDASPCHAATLDDVDVDYIEREYIPRAVDARDLALDSRPLQHKMAALGLYSLRHDCPTNACIVLFGHSPQQFLPGAYLQFVDFEGKEKSSSIKNERAFCDSLAKMMPKLEAFIDYGVIKQRPVAVSTLRERNQINYPADALRELILNAFMHRDYLSNMPVRFYHFVDRIELMNAGGLYGKARPENFPNVNDYRNPIIAQALKVMGYVNMFNRGIARVCDMMRNNGCPLPTFDVAMLTVFHANCYPAFALNDEEVRESWLSPPQHAALFAKLVPSIFPKDKIPTLERIIEKLQTPQKAADLAETVKMEVRSFRYHYLTKLLEAGILSPTQPDKLRSSKQQYKLML